jgi:ADP-ribosylation factor-like protein 1
MGSYWASEEKRCLVTGLDGAGKTTIIYRLQENATVTSAIPTLSIMHEERFLGIKWRDIDLGGQEKIRKYHQLYWENSQFVIFVVDLSDRENLATARYELHFLLHDEGLNNAKFLIVGNKSDIEGCMSGIELIDKLYLHEYAHRNWDIITCSALRESEWKKQIIDFVHM